MKDLVAIPDAGMTVAGADKFLSPGSLLSGPSNTQNPAYLHNVDFTGGIF